MWWNLLLIDTFNPFWKRLSINQHSKQRKHIANSQMMQLGKYNQIIYEKILGSLGQKRSTVFSLVIPLHLDSSVKEALVGPLNLYLKKEKIYENCSFEKWTPSYYLLKLTHNLCSWKKKRFLDIYFIWQCFRISYSKQDFCKS